MTDSEEDMMQAMAAVSPTAPEPSPPPFERPGPGPGYTGHALGPLPPPPPSHLDPGIIRTPHEEDGGGAASGVAKKIYNCVINNK